MDKITSEILRYYLNKNKRFRIVFTGDSITSTEWVHPNWREIIEYVLKEEQQKKFEDWKVPSWGIRGINSGLDGSTTADILERINRDIVAYEPDMVIGLMGGNDPVLGISPEESKANIERITGILSETVPWTVWCTSTPAARVASKNEEYGAYARATMEIPESERIKFVDMFNIYNLFDPERFFTFKSEENPVEGIKAGDPDNWHPNQLGNAYIAKVLLEEVFGVEFDPEKYMETTLAGEKYPAY